MWLDKILAEIREMENEKDVITAAIDVGPGEHVVGILDQDLRKFSCLVWKYQIRLQEIEQLSEDSGHTKELAQAQMHAQVLETLFWVSIRERFPDLWGQMLLGIRKDWKLVWIEPGPQVTLPLAAIGFLIPTTFDDIFEEPTEAQGDKKYLH